jgi:hypothetical protein
MDQPARVGGADRSAQATTQDFDFGNLALKISGDPADGQNVSVIDGWQVGVTCRTKHTGD